MPGDRMLSHIAYNLVQMAVVMGFTPLVAGVINRLKLLGGFFATLAGGLPLLCTFGMVATCQVQGCF